MERYLRSGFAGTAALMREVRFLDPSSPRGSLVQSEGAGMVTFVSSLLVPCAPGVWEQRLVGPSWYFRALHPTVAASARCVCRYEERALPLQFLLFP